MPFRVMCWREDYHTISTKALVWHCVAQRTRVLGIIEKQLYGSFPTFASNLTHSVSGLLYHFLPMTTLIVAPSYVVTLIYLISDGPTRKYSPPSYCTLIINTLKGFYFHIYIYILFIPSTPHRECWGLSRIISPRCY